MAKLKSRTSKSAYVPRVVFTVAVVAVVPSLAPVSCGGGPVFSVFCSMCSVAAVAMGGFGGVGAGGAGGSGGTSPTGSGGTGGTSPTGTGGAGGSGGSATGTGGGGGTASLDATTLPVTGFTMPADPRAVGSLADAAKPAKKSRARARRRG